MRRSTSGNCCRPAMCMLTAGFWTFRSVEGVEVSGGGGGRVKERWGGARCEFKKRQIVT